MDVDKRVALGFYGQLDKGHIGIFWAASAFFDVAVSAGADNVFPGRFAADTAGDNMVERQLACRKFFTAILAAVLVASKEVSAIEFDVVSRQAVVKKQPYYLRNCDIEVNRRDPVV